MSIQLTLLDVELTMKVLVESRAGPVNHQRALYSNQLFIVQCPLSIESKGVVMNEASLEFLQQLLEAPSPSGYEQPAQRVFRSYITPFSQVATDVIGNVFGFIPGVGENRPRVMLVGHSD